MKNALTVKMLYPFYKISHLGLQKVFFSFISQFRLVDDLGFSRLLLTAKYMHTVPLFLVQSIIIPMDLQRPLCLPRDSVHLISS